MPRGIRKAAPQVVAAPREAEPALSPRAEATRRERRLRDPGDLDRRTKEKLAIPLAVQERLTREKKTARWVFDDPNRLEQVASIDWDVTPGVDPIASDGMKLVLHEKHADWYDEDRTALQKSMDEKDRLIRSAKIKADGSAIDDDFNRELARSNRISTR